MAPLSVSSLAAIQRELSKANLDGWLLYDFRGCNSIASGMIGLHGFMSRRGFAYVPREGTPIAISHRIEQGPWSDWPAEWRNERYSSWRELEQLIAATVGGKRIAMEYSAGDAVPYLDRVPAGVIEMVRAAGAEPVSSGELVTRFFALWTPEQFAAHSRAAEVIAQIAKDAFAVAAQRARGGADGPMSEYTLMQWILGKFSAAGLSTDHGPNVSVGANAANPHYEPTIEASAPITDGSIVLIDLWATEAGGIYADQTWMASLGKPSAEAVRVWEAVRDARDAAIDFVTTGVAAGRTLRGADVDDAARKVIVARGFGEYFTHRTGHSIDARDLHGSGPHLDNLETREERVLVPGVGFSIEPGIYIPGRVGMRSEVNVFLAEGRAIVTPTDYQRELFVL